MLVVLPSVQTDYEDLKFNTLLCQVLSCPPVIAVCNHICRALVQILENLNLHGSIHIQSEEPTVARIIQLASANACLIFDFCPTSSVFDLLNRICDDGHQALRKVDHLAWSYGWIVRPLSCIFFFSGKQGIVLDLSMNINSEGI